MRKFWRITLIQYRNAFIRDSKLSNRVLAGMFTNLLDGITQLVMVLVIFSKAPTIGGWNIYETLILTTTLQLILLIHGSWTKRGTAIFAESMVHRGDYDFYMTKPFNPMVSVSISKPRIYNLVKLPFFIGILVYAIGHLDRPIPLPNILWFILLFICGYLTFYAIRIITVVPAFWIIKSWSLTLITDRIQNIMKYPATIYPRSLVIIFSSVLPILAIAYFPAKVLLFEPRISYIVYTVFITVVFLIIAQLFWKFGEKYYGSASS